jgi:PAS domain S-box-containing protein
MLELLTGAGAACGIGGASGVLCGPSSSWLYAAYSALTGLALFAMAGALRHHALHGKANASAAPRVFNAYLLVAGGLFLASALAALAAAPMLAASIAPVLAALTLCVAAIAWRAALRDTATGPRNAHSTSSPPLPSSGLNDQERSRDIFDDHPLPMWIRDNASGKFLAVNEAAIEVYGYSRVEFGAMTTAELGLPEEVPELLDYMRPGAQERRSRERSRHRRRDGSIIEVEMASHPYLPFGDTARLVIINDVTERVKAERAVREAEQRYYTLFEDSPDGVMLVDPATATIIECNHSLREMLGYPADEILRVPLAHLDARTNEADLRAHIEQVMTKGSDIFETRLRRVTGEFLEAVIRIRVVTIAGRQLLLTVIRDVTEQKHATAALLESETRLRTVTNNIPALIGYVDADQRYRFANKTYEDWFGRSPEADSGRTIREIVGEDEFRALRPHIEGALGGRTITVERQMAGTRGELYTRVTYLPHRDAAERVLGFYIFGYDITERRRAEEELARERTLLRQVVDNLPDEVWVKDRDCRYLMVNAAGLAIRGLKDTSAAVGCTAEDFFPGEEAATFEAEDRHVMDFGVPLINRETTRSGGDTQRWLLTSKMPLRDQGGEVFGLVGVNRDITQMRERDDLVRQLNAELEQRVIERTAQLEATNRELESFSYSVSHDLRAPLRSIEGFSLALLEDYGERLDGTGKDYIKRVHGASQRMANLIEDLLSLSRISRTEMRRSTLDVAALARRIAGELAREQPGRAVHFVAPKLIPASADESLLLVALENLLRNAWKFTGRCERAQIEVGAQPGAGQTVYFVRDNGVGFDMSYASKLFGAFQRLHSVNDFPGSGIGLATVQRIIHRHGGRVWAESTPEHGATFYFTLGGEESDATPGVPGDRRAVRPGST